MNEILYCPCGRRMQMVMDTPLCPICNQDVIRELNVNVKRHLRNMKGVKK